jgi:arylsulfatase
MRASVVCLVVVLFWPPGALGQGKRPNIVVIWGDDIGMWNVGVYTTG